MTTALQLRRGTTDQHATFVGANGEVTVDTDKKTLVVNDGVTPGGTPLAREDSLTKFVRHDTAAQGLTGTQQSNVKTNIGLGNVSNTSDADKPVSTATQEAFDGKLDKSGGTLTGALTLTKALTLSGNATTALGAVPKQQVETLINTAVTGLTSAYNGGRGHVFTSSGTFTVPTGVTSVKVRGCGGGSGGGRGGGYYGATGGATSFGNHCSATGGSWNAPGAAWDGDIVISGGGSAETNSSANSAASGGACGGASGVAGSAANNYAPAPGGILGGRSGNNSSTPATGYGNGGGATYQAASRVSGTGGGYFEKYITGLTPGNTITVTVGKGGSGTSSGSAGSPGICIVEW